MKCDLSRPECERCLRVGKPCPGYRDETSLLFRNEDATTLMGPSVGRDRRRLKTKEVFEIDSPGSTAPQNLPEPTRSLARFDFTAMDSIVMQQGWHSHQLRLHPEQWGSLAVQLVLSMRSAQRPHDSRYFGKAEFLPAMLLRQNDEAALTLCCRALGLAFLTNKSGTDTANTIRDRAYGQALAAANGLVSDPVLCRTDEASVSVWLLSLYETVTGPQSPIDVTIPAVTWSIHTQGLLQLLRLRGPEQLQTHTGRSVFWILVGPTQALSLIAGIECPSFIRTWLDDLDDRDLIVDADLVRLSEFAYNTALTSATICRSLRGSSSGLPGPEIDSVWFQVQAIDVLFREAMDGLPLDEVVSLDKVNQCNMYRAYYMRTLQFMLDLAQCGFSQRDSAVDRSQISAMVAHGTSTISSLTAQTVRTIPYILGPQPLSATSAISAQQAVLDRSVCWGDVLQLLWPLRIIMARKQLVGVDDIQTVNNALFKMSADYCIRQAVAPCLLTISAP